MQHDPLVPWSQIDTVLLDMDGTLLDLHFDNHFWLEVIPQKLAEKLNQPLAQTKAYMTAECAKVFGQSGGLMKHLASTQSCREGLYT